MGKAVGVTDGAVLGQLVGASDGISVGVSVGAPDGSVDGFAEMNMGRAEDGMQVGAVGRTDGCSDGDTVEGANDGRMVG